MLLYLQFYSVNSINKIKVYQLIQNALWTYNAKLSFGVYGFFIQELLNWPICTRGEEKSVKHSNINEFILG